MTPSQASLERKAVQEIKDELDRSPKWRRIVSTSGAHFYERRSDKHRVVIRLTEQEAKVDGL